MSRLSSQLCAMFWAVLVTMGVHGYVARACFINRFGLKSDTYV